MKRAAFFIALLLTSLRLAHAQEILATVNVNYTKIGASNNSIYETLKKNLTEFINATQWTKQEFAPQERIECLFNIIIEETVDNRIKASVQVQLRRPVYNSTYYTPIFSINDKQFHFDYSEFDPLIFDERRFSGKNLTDVVAYYVYLILGYDADTFSNGGGDIYFSIARKIADNAESSDFPGWSVRSGQRNRKKLVDDLLSLSHKPLRKIWYIYHRRGLDLMYGNPEGGKQTIANALLELDNLPDFSLAESYPMDLFIKAKQEEIIKIFSDGPIISTDMAKLKELLIRLAPAQSDRWNDLKS